MVIARLPKATVVSVDSPAVSDELEAAAAQACLRICERRVIAAGFMTVRDLNPPQLQAVEAEWSAWYRSYIVVHAGATTEADYYEGTTMTDKPTSREITVAEHIRVARSFLNHQKPPNIRMAIERLIEAVELIANGEPNG